MTWIRATYRFSKCATILASVIKIGPSSIDSCRGLFMKASSAVDSLFFRKLNEDSIPHGI